MYTYIIQIIFIKIDERKPFLPIKREVVASVKKKKVWIRIG